MVAAPYAEPLPAAAAVEASSEASFGDYWAAGAFVDLASRASGAAGARAAELERRVVLSQYALRVHSAGSTPPQETGLLCNSWGGKHHSEMRFWHQVGRRC